jgi:hypothetical protein
MGVKHLSLQKKLHGILHGSAGSDGGARIGCVGGCGDVAGLESGGGWARQGAAGRVQAAQVREE